MFRVIDEKDSGKTRKLLEECGKHNGLFVCRHPERVTEKCIAYGLPFVEAIGYDQYKKAIKSEKPVYIDELEKFVEYIILNFNGYSLSKEE